MAGKPLHEQAADITRELTRPDPYAPAQNRYTTAADSVRGETWVENPWGWVIFFGVIGAVMVGFPTKSIIGALIGSVLFGSPPAILAHIVGGGRVRLALPRLRGLGPWPAWSIAGVALGVAAAFGVASMIDVTADMDAAAWRGAAIVVAFVTVLTTMVRLVLGLFVKTPKPDKAARIVE
jgi:hypothetical protein